MESWYGGNRDVGVLMAQDLFLCDFFLFFLNFWSWSSEFCWSIATPKESERFWDASFFLQLAGVAEIH